MRNVTCSREESGSTDGCRTWAERVSKHDAAGFTLLELLVSMAILTIVSMLTFMVTQSSASAAAVAQAKQVAQANVRDAMTAMIAEVQLAAKQGNDALAPPLEALSVVSESEVVFQLPLDDSGTLWSTPITYRFINEDTGETPNARLDEVE